MEKMRRYSAPTAVIANIRVERGFCVSLEFSPEIENAGTRGGLGLEDMVENSDNAAW